MQLKHPWDVNSSRSRIDIDISRSSASATPGHTPNLNVTFNRKSKADVNPGPSRIDITFQVARNELYLRIKS